MMKLPAVFLFVLGMFLGAMMSNDVRAEESGLKYFPSSEGTIADNRPSGEDPFLEEGAEGDGVTNRGIGRFKGFKRKLVPLKRKPKLKKGFRPSRSFRLRKPITPPASTTPPSETPPTQPPSAQQCEWRTSDIIDQRIEISAQQSLMRMMSHGDVAERRAASAMIGAIKNGTLAGIHAPFLGRKAVADRAAIVPPPGTKGYWSLLQPGQLGMCLKEPMGVPPMLLYREKNQHASVIDQTLKTKWAECGLPTPDPPCSYIVDLWKPSSECEISKDCIDKGLGNFCTEENKCETHLPGGTITPGSQPNPTCDALNYFTCPDGLLCNPDGSCRPPSQCIENARKTKLQEQQACRDAEKPKLTQCLFEKGLAAAKCIYDAGSERARCERAAHDRYEHKRTVTCKGKP